MIVVLLQIANLNLNLNVESFNSVESFFDIGETDHDQHFKANTAIVFVCFGCSTLNGLFCTKMPSGLSPLGQKVFRALQKYGAYVTDVSGGCTTFGAQQNAYDDPTMTALWHDSGKIIPLLKSVAVP